MIPGWLDAIDAEVGASLRRRGSLSPRELAEALGVSEACAVRYITLLADAGRLCIRAVTLPSASGGSTAPAPEVPRAA